MLKSKTYTVAWDEVMDNAIDFDRQMRSGGLEYVVFDVSNVPVERENWVVADKVRYFGHFYNSLKDFVESEFDIFIFDAGDAFGDCKVELTRSIEKAMGEDPDIWIMAPNIINECGPGKDPVSKTIFKTSNKYSDRNYVLTVHINGIWVAMSRELATKIYEYYEWALANGKMNFRKMTTGHGLDCLYAAWTLYSNKKIYRDLSFEIETGDVTSYDTSVTMFDYLNVVEGFVDFIRSTSSGNAKVVKYILEAIQQRIRVEKDEFPLGRIYLNMVDVEEFDY